jgi:hypothetical protein
LQEKDRERLALRDKDSPATESESEAISLVPEATLAACTCQLNVCDNKEEARIWLSRMRHVFAIILPVGAVVAFLFALAQNMVPGKNDIPVTPK